MKTNHSPKEYVYGIIVALIVNLVLGFLQLKPTVVLFPNNSITPIPYSDQTRDYGSSRFDTTTIDSSLTFSYFLTQDNPWPFAGIRFEPATPLDLRHYDELILSVSVEREQKEIVALWAAPHKSYPDSAGEQPFHYSIHFYPEQDTYTLSLSDFTTPPWWLENNNLEPNDIVKDIFSTISAVGIRSGFVSISDMERAFTINSITLVKNRGILYAQTALVFLLSIILVWLRQIWLRSVSKRLVIPIKDLNISAENETLHTVVEVIGNECDNSSMSLALVAEKSGVPETEVSKTVKEAFGLSFKQYLNRVRMEIATTLLAESELTIKEIAFKSGYTNKSHFFRVFKTFYNESPSEYRKRSLKNSSQN